MEVITHKTPEHLEKGHDLAGKPLTPKSERPRSTWGSLQMSLQTLHGLCNRERLCIFKEGHEGGCWPS